MVALGYYTRPDPNESRMGIFFTFQIIAPTVIQGPNPLFFLILDSHASIVFANGGRLRPPLPNTPPNTPAFIP